MTEPAPRSIRIEPATGLLAGSSIAVTLWWWTGGDVELFTMASAAWSSQPWRLFSSVLPHVDLMHLIFNIYWLCIFGGKLESVFGSVKTVLVFLLLGAGSSLADYGFSASGVGLSGIGYGLFGFLWVLGRQDPRFRDTLSRQVVQLFVFWFFLCIALTIADIWQVGNVAHGVGALLGVLLGWSVSLSSSILRVASRAALCLVIVVILLAASIGRPYVNFSSSLADEFAYLGYEALEDQDFVHAMPHFEAALKLRPEEDAWWFDLGITYHGLNRPEDAIAAYTQALELAPSDAQYKHALIDIKAWLAYQKQTTGGTIEAIRLYREVVQMDETNSLVYYNLAAAYLELDNASAARKAIARAVALEPENDEYRRLLEDLVGAPVNQVLVD